ncbi:hypothetical protein AALP_AAs68104U000100 [Arabis alpina]|uniref:Uncharacterized protein n=1 Tax=Arabis alpina TaxID=50452 RepID=A0A087G1F2_ARAAL|nr:hypothetical protein AALP_AAs68104U000100 [Arabis alpina]
MENSEKGWNQCGAHLLHQCPFGSPPGPTTSSSTSSCSVLSQL